MYKLDAVPGEQLVAELEKRLEAGRMDSEWRAWRVAVSRLLSM